MANREQRFGVRVECEMSFRWYTAAAGGEATAHDGTTVDISATGAAFDARDAPAVEETIVVHLVSEDPPLDVAAPVRVVRVTRAAGGYRCAVQFDPANAANRAVLGRFVLAVIRDRVA
jgi:c-di-GMP-binding flagellar brake protein YcgR